MGERMKHHWLLLLVLLASIPAFAKTIAESQWQQGTLVSITTDAHTRAFGSIYNGTGSYSQHEYVVTHYLIDTPEYRYEANRTLKVRWDKQLLVTVNGPIQFFFDGKKFYIRDEQKKQHELDFVQKIKK
jgi:hypothetical protein